MELIKYTNYVIKCEREKKLLKCIVLKGLTLGKKILQRI